MYSSLNQTTGLIAFAAAAAATGAYVPEAFRDTIAKMNDDQLRALDTAALVALVLAAGAAGLARAVEEECADISPAPIGMEFTSSGRYVVLTYTTSAGSMSRLEIVRYDEGDTRCTLQLTRPDGEVAGRDSHRAQEVHRALFASDGQ